MGEKNIMPEYKSLDKWNKVRNHLNSNGFKVINEFYINKKNGNIKN
jgi:hypothetical protein